MKKLIIFCITALITIGITAFYIWSALFKCVVNNAADEVSKKNTLVYTAHTYTDKDHQYITLYAIDMDEPKIDSVKTIHSPNCSCKKLKIQK